MCGCTRRPSPRRRAQARSRESTTVGAMRRPRPPTKSARLARRGELRPARDPGLERLARLRADRHRARFRSLAGDRDFALAEIEAAVVHVERDHLPQAQPRRIHELEHRGVAHQLRAARLLVEQALRRLDRERLGKRPRRLGRAHADHRVGGEAVVPHQPVVEAAPGREHQRERARAEAARVHHGDEAAHLDGIERSKICFLRQLEKRLERMTVIGQRRRERRR